MQHLFVPPVLVLAVALLLASCTGKSEQELTTSAQQLLAKNDAKGAVIELKAALAQRPESAQARLLLGQALLAGGDPVGAAVELGKAQGLMVSDDLVVPELARAMLALRDDRKLLAQFGQTQLADRQAQADLLTTLANAQLRLGEPAKAADLIDAALRAAPGYAAATVVQARQKAADKDPDAALAILDATLARQPDNEAAGLLRAEVLWLGKKDAERGLQGYKQVLAAHPNSVDAHTALIAMYSLRGDAQAVKAEVVALEQTAPAHPETLFHRAQFAYAEGNYKEARELAEGLMKVLPDDSRLLELAGMIEFRAAQYVQAEGYLGRALKARPSQLQPRHALAQTYLRTGQPAKALAILAPVLDTKSPDGLTLALAGEAYLQKGDAKQAEAALQRAVKAAPMDVDVRATAARVQFARGEAGPAVAALEKAVSDAETPRADLALISARLRQNDMAGALKAVDALQKKLPQSPLPDHLRGQILRSQKKDAEAVKSFEAALAKQANYFDAVSNLASMELLAGRADAARQRFQAFLKANPNHPQALLAMAELAARTGASRKVVAQGLRDAVKADPLNKRAQEILVDHLLSSGDAPGAVAAAQSAAVALPTDFDIMAMLGRTLLAAKDVQQALSTLKKLAALQPNSGPRQVSLAEAYVANQDPESALHALNKALELSPGLPEARRGLVALALMDKRPQDAIKQVRLLQQQRPKDASGFVLEGDIEASRRAWDAAATAYRAALQRDAGVETVLKLHNALLQGGKQADADRLAADWQKAQPNNPAFQFYLGDRAMGRQDYATAEALYGAVLQRQPNNALALNNLAWIAVKLDKPGGRALAERAIALMPEQAPLLDTLAMTLAQEKEWSKAIEVQKRAISRSPSDPALKLNLARYYLKSGDKSQARTELEALEKLGSTYSGQPEVLALLREAR